MSGVAAFFTASYIIFVNPAVLTGAGIRDYSSLVAATCMASALGCFLVALIAKTPIVMIPGMGLNAYFVSVCAGGKVGWQAAFGLVVLSGIVMLAFTLAGLRWKQLFVIPDCLKSGISAGIGLFIGMVGMGFGGVMKFGKDGMRLGDLSTAEFQIYLIGLLVSIFFIVNKKSYALLLGILAAWAYALASGATKIELIPPAVPGETFGALDFSNAFKVGSIPIVFSFFFVAMLDGLGASVAILNQAGISDHLKLGKTLVVNGISTVAGGVLGTSPMVVGIESASGVSSGGRTGMMAATCGVLFLVALPLYFVIYSIAQCKPIVGPALTLVGLFMMKEVSKVQWDDFTEAIPAFLTAIFMPFTFAVENGLYVGLVSFVLVKLFAGRAREIPGVIFFFACLVVIKFIILG